MTDLYDALAAGDLERVRRLLRAGAAPDEPEPAAGETPLQAAIDGGHGTNARYVAVHELLAFGANPGGRDRNGSGPLFLALVHQDPRVLELLLRHGADPNAEYGYLERSLLWWAYWDYCTQTWGERLPETPPATTGDDPDALLDFLDRLARRHRKPRPECLRLLRLYGAAWRAPAPQCSA